MTRSRLLATVVLLAMAVAVASFLGGSVGSMVAGRSPVGFLAVGPPHLQLPPGHPFPALPLTNTMLSAWLSSVTIAFLLIWAGRRPTLLPTGLQSVVEYTCEVAINFVEEMVGRKQERRFFPVIMTVFLFVLANAWFALLPGFESVKMNGVPLLRSANTDINVPLMLALVCVVSIEYWGLTTRHGAYVRSFFRVGELARGIASFVRGRFREAGSQLFTGVILLFVGLLELLGHLIRVLSFSFRLFGNMLAGVVLTGVALFLVPLVLPTLFYGLEVLFGVVQALIFAGLTAVFGYAAVSASEH